MLRLLHITLAFSLLSSQAGLPLWQHYCKGELIGTTILGPAVDCFGEKEEKGESCHMTDVEPSCPLHVAQKTVHNQGPQLEANCCSDELGLSKLAQLQQVVNQSDWEHQLATGLRAPEVQIETPLLPRGEEMLLPQLERPPPLIPSGRDLRIRLKSYLC